jgi:membrane-bound lytic murein transglycosylase B
MTKKWIKSIVVLTALLTTNVFAANFIDRPEVQEFVAKMQKQHNLDPVKVNMWLSHAKTDQKVLNAIQKPYEALPWYKYQTFFIKQSKIDDGVEFWKNNKDTLARAEKEFGVPQEIIVAILGVESRYGKIKGGFPLLDSLATLGFDYPPRAKFFLSELEQFLLLANEENWDPKEIKGSYAGAMGQAQFISSSYRHYAIDYNGDGKRDLINNTDDAIGSIANYFKVHGWQKGLPIVFPANVSGSQFKKIQMSRTTPKPEHSLKDLNRLGVAIGQKGGVSTPSLYKERLALFELEEKNGESYWLGTQNFYVITRYNHSNLYAMAVYELSEKIKANFA